MRAGPLRNRCSLQQSTREPDGAGGYRETWSEVAQVWAEIKPLSGRLAPVAQQLDALVTAEIIVRWRAGIEPGQRLTCKGITYTIEAALPDEKQTLLRLLCSSIPHP